jgi:branched-chain amino acid aminotransferase
MSVDYFPTAYFEGEFRPFAEARVSVATHALQYGSGVFGGIRGYLSEDERSINIFRLHDHARRVFVSARLIGIDLNLSADLLAETIVELVRQNRPKSDVYIRPFAYKSGLDLPPGMHGVASDVALYMAPLGRFYETGTDGLSVTVSSWRRIEDNALPARAKISGAYVNSSLAKDAAVASGFDDAILLNEDGSVAEGSSSNLAIVRKGQLITPPVTDNILEGITRQSMLEIAQDQSIPVVDRSIDRTELYVADEVLFFGTAVEVSRVGSLDGRVVADGRPGPVFSQLAERFRRVVRGKDNRFADWLTTVK